MRAGTRGEELPAAGSAEAAGLAPLVDEPALDRYLEEHLPGWADERGPLEAERHQAGHSNETFFLRRGGHRWVLRRPPRGAFLPTAHDVVREYRVLSAVSGTPVRAPRPILLCEDPSVIGAPFYVMERIDGEVIRDRIPLALDRPAERRRIGEELVDALAELHAVDWRAVGLEGFGKPAGYLERQVRRWKGQLALTEPLTRHVPELHRAGQWLEGHVPPAGDACIVHGDYKLDNVCFAPTAPARLVAILDWEMATLGDPLADLGWMLSFWPEDARQVDPVLEDLVPARLEGVPTSEDLLRRYEERSGREVGDLTFFLVLAVWKLAILLEGSYARHLAGATDDPFFARMERAVPALARRALAFAAG